MGKQSDRVVHSEVTARQLARDYSDLDGEGISWGKAQHRSAVVRRATCLVGEPIDPEMERTYYAGL